MNWKSYFLFFFSIITKNIQNLTKKKRMQREEFIIDLETKNILVLKGEE